MYGVDGDIASLLQKFNGASYLLLGVFLYLLKSQKGKTLYVTICAINIIGFIHLYLIFLFFFAKLSQLGSGPSCRRWPFPRVFVIYDFARPCFFSFG